MTDVEKLIAEGRKGADDPNWRFCTPACPSGTHAHALPLVTRLANALEAEHERAESMKRQRDTARHGSIEWESAFSRVEAERDRYHEGLYQVYVQLGEDTDGARNAAELFRPMTNTDPAEWVPRLVAEYRAEMERESDAIEAERDRYRAAIEEARTHEWSSFGDSNTYRILTAALDETKED